MPDWVRDKLILPLIVGIGAFILGTFSDEIKARFFPSTQKIEITNVTYQRGVRLGDYLKVTGNDSSRFSVAQLRARGSVVFADVQATGYKGHELHMAGTVLTPTRGAAHTRRPSQWDRFFKPATDTSQQSPDIWLADPCKKGRFLVSVRIEKQIPRGFQHLRQADGPTFRLNVGRC